MCTEINSYELKKAEDFFKWGENAWKRLVRIFHFCLY